MNGFASLALAVRTTHTGQGHICLSDQRTTLPPQSLEEEVNP